MTTLSTEALSTQLRTRLLGFVPAPPNDVGWITLNTRLGGVAAGSGRLWKDSPPDNAAYPYGVMRLVNQETNGEYAGERQAMDLEVVLYGRPRSQADDMEDAADVCDQAMLRYVDSSSGLTFSKERQRDTLPPPADPADREVVQVRLLYSVKSWPRFLTKHSSP